MVVEDALEKLENSTERRDVDGVGEANGLHFLFQSCFVLINLVL